MSQHKAVKFLLKSVDDIGTFDGLAAVYGNLDLGGDVIAPGAFTKTIRDKGGEVPILWQHEAKTPIGLGTLTDTAEGLHIHGDLVLGTKKGQEAYALMKARVLRGLSIGYDTVVSEYDSEHDVRTLKELKLYEVSAVTFPMNPEAQIDAVKCWSEVDEAIAALDARSVALATQLKAGRTLSAASLARVQASHDAVQHALANLQALIDDAAADDADKSAAIRNAKPDPHFAIPDFDKTLASWMK